MDIDGYDFSMTIRYDYDTVMSIILCSAASVLGRNSMTLDGRSVMMGLLFSDGLSRIAATTHDE